MISVLLLRACLDRLLVVDPFSIAVAGVLTGEAIGAYSSMLVFVTSERGREYMQ